MKISNSLLAAYKIEVEKGATFKKQLEKKKIFPLSPKPDSVEISSDAHSKRLDEIKKKVRSGFYSSSAVRDDLSEKLSTVLDDITG